MTTSVCALMLVACGGEGGDAGPEKVRDFVEITNLDSSRFPWHSVGYPNGVADGQLKRWQGLVPIKLNGSSVAEQAINEIERRLKTTLFDRTSIADIADEDIVRGLIISEGTSVDGSYKGSCGNVAYAPNEYSFPNSLYDPEHGEIGFYSAEGEVSTKLYVNIGSDNCSPRVNIAIHELGHALGMGEHFDGFGKGPAINENFWKVLFTIYGNEVGTEKEQLSIIMSL